MLAIISYLDIVSALFSVASNAILIFFVLTKSPIQFGNYKYLMVFIAVFEMIMVLMEALLVPMYYSHDSAVVMLVNVSKTPFSPQTVSMLLLTNLGLFGASMFIFAAHFVYRYLVVSGSPLIHTFESWKLFLWLLLPFSSGMTWAITAFFLCSPTQESDEFLRDGILWFFGESIENFEYRLFKLYKHLENGAISYNFNSLVALGIASFTVSSSLFIILLFGFKCYNHIRKLMKKSGTVSSHSNAIQHQLFYALVVQTLIPVLFIHTPISFLFVWALFEIEVGRYVYIVPIFTAIYCFLDSLPNFFIIKPYRTALFGNWEAMKCFDKGVFRLPQMPEIDKYG